MHILGAVFLFYEFIIIHCFDAVHPSNISYTTYKLGLLNSIDSIVKSSMTKQLDEFKVYTDAKLKLKYQILNKLGQGCFGTIYKVINRLMNVQNALKLQLQDAHQDHNSRSNLSNEIAILERLKGIKGIPKVYGAGKWGYGYYLELELLSSSLQDENAKELSEVQVCYIICELILILKEIHRRGIVHQDIKPQNIMRDEKGCLRIIDFGLSAYYSLNKTNKDQKVGFVGTPRYASLAAHQGLAQKPKDDIESLMYVLGGMYLKKAPWFELKGPTSKRLERIHKLKQSNNSGWFKQCGQQFFLAYQYLSSLTPSCQLDHDYLISIFQFTRKTKKNETLKLPQNQHTLYGRRKSDSVMTVSKALSPTDNIILNLLPVTKRSMSKRVTWANKLDQEDGSEGEGPANFSQVAQDGYLELIQILTQNILSSSLLDNKSSGSENYDEHPQNSMCTANSINNYKMMNFKNPFEAS